MNPGELAALPVAYEWTSENGLDTPGLTHTRICGNTWFSILSIVHQAVCTPVGLLKLPNVMSTQQVLAIVVVALCAHVATASGGSNLATAQHTGTVKSGKGTGRVAKLGGLNAYVATPQKPTDLAVIIFTDIYGWEFNNTRMWADKLAKNGAVAIIPDFFKNDSIPVGADLSGAWFARW